MQLSKAGLRFIANMEGFRSLPYVCPAGKLTIGFGHLVTPVEKEKFKDGITRQQGEALLEADVQRYVVAVNKLVTHSLSQAQFDALVSFVYNVGITAFASSTLRKRLNEGKVDEAANEFGKWVNGGGKRLPGLVKRRFLEKAMFEGKH